MSSSGTSSQGLSPSPVDQEASTISPSHSSSESPPLSDHEYLTALFKQLNVKFPLMVQWLRANQAQIERNLLPGKREILAEMLIKFDGRGFVTACQTNNWDFTLTQLLDFTVAVQKESVLPPFSGIGFPVYALTPQHKYFIALCHYQKHRCDLPLPIFTDHSFVVSGAYNASKPELRPLIFSSIGKGNSVFLPAQGKPWYAWNSWLRDEQYIRTQAVRRWNIECGKTVAASVSYQAYDLSFEQHQNYLAHISSYDANIRAQLQRRYPPEALMPARVALPKRSPLKYYQTFLLGERQYAFERNEPGLPALAPQLQALAKPLPKGLAAQAKVNFSHPVMTTYNINHLGNTCRHTALALLRQGYVEKDSGLSNCYLKTFKSKAKVFGGEFIEPIFVRPLPVSEDFKNRMPEMYKILNLLRQEMIKLSQTNYGLQLAHYQFAALKELYQTLHERATPKMDFTYLKIQIGLWKKQESKLRGGTNAELVNVSRRTGIFRYSLFHWGKTDATVKVEKLERELEKLAKKRYAQEGEVKNRIK